MIVYEVTSFFKIEHTKKKKTNINKYTLTQQTFKSTITFYIFIIQK